MYTYSEYLMADFQLQLDVEFIESSDDNPHRRHHIPEKRKCMYVCMYHTRSLNIEDAISYIYTYTHIPNKW